MRTCTSKMRHLKGLARVVGNGEEEKEKDGLDGEGQAAVAGAERVGEGQKSFEEDGGCDSGQGGESQPLKIQHAKSVYLGTTAFLPLLLAGCVTMPQTSNMPKHTSATDSFVDGEHIYKKAGELHV
jgi:hypothetical protein